MPPRFVRSPESGGLRPRAVGLPLQVPGPTSSPAVYQGPRNVAFTSNPQPIMTAINDNKMVRLGGLTPQQQQMLLRQQLHQQRQALLQQQQELTQVCNDFDFIIYKNILLFSYTYVYNKIVLPVLVKDTGLQ